MPFIDENLVILRIPVSLKILVKLVLDLSDGILQAVSTRRVSDGPQPAVYVDISLIVSHGASGYRTVINPDDRVIYLLIRNGLRTGERILLTWMG